MLSAMEPSLAQELLGAEEVGLAPAAPLPFVFTAPERMTPLVISFPHVGLEWPEDLSPKPQVNFARNADLGVHTLYPGASQHAACVQARYSRLVVDLNRAADDVDLRVVPDHPKPMPRAHPSGSAGRNRSGLRVENRGVVWANAIGNIPMFSRPLSFPDFERRIDSFHAPYYRAVEVLLQRRVARFGYAVLLDAHSMPGSVPGHLILGTLDGGSCAPLVAGTAARALRADDGLDVRIDDPYRGGEVVRYFGRPTDGIHALQLEVNRGLYMDELRAELWTTKAQGARRAQRLGGPTKLQRQYLSALLRRLERLVRDLADLHL